MKIFEYCPFCQSLLQSYENGNVSIRKKCLVCKKIDVTCKNINNKILFPNELLPDNEIYNVEVTITDKIIVGWWLEANEMYIYEPNPMGSSLKLPFIEPDFSDYSKLCKKIKLYALFS